eukprot:10509925-Prorocentrum_lima.AAC.1
MLVKKVLSFFPSSAQTPLSKSGGEQSLVLSLSLVVLVPPETDPLSPPGPASWTTRLTEANPSPNH